MIKKVISHKVCHPEAPERLRPTGEGPPVTTTNEGLTYPTKGENPFSTLEREY